MERSQREDGVELQIENERRRARREMAARKGSWERAHLPAPKECEGTPCRGRVLLPDRDEFGAGEETASASAFPPLLLTPFLSLLPSYLPSCHFRTRLRSPHRRQSSPPSPCTASRAPSLALGRRRSSRRRWRGKFSIRWVFLVDFYCPSLVRVGAGRRGEREGEGPRRMCGVDGR